MADDYSIAWRTYDAQYWGVPQRRKRIYLVADFTGRRAGIIQFERESLCGNFTQGCREGEGTAGASKDDAGASGQRVTCLMDMGGSKMDIAEGITGTLRANAKGHDPIIIDTWAIQGNMIGRKEKNGPQGSGINKNVCFTLDAADRHAVVCPAIVYGISARQSGGWLSENPHSGIYEAEATRTIDTRGGNPACAQGGNIIVQEARVFENHSQDSRYRELGSISETVAAKYGTGGNNMPIVIEGKVYSIGNGQVHDLGLDPKAKTLSCMHDQQAVITPEENGFPYRARRLTPLECCRLQGYPDWWCSGLDEPDPDEEEVNRWASVFEIHRKAVRSSAKPRTEKQVRKWLQHPQTDSAEYRMWGNSLAIPCAYQVLSGIAEALTESERRKSNAGADEEDGKKSPEAPSV